MGTNICPKFTLNSDGKSREVIPEILGVYELHNTMNNGRVVFNGTYKHAIDAMRIPIWFYSIHTNKEGLSNLKGAWMVRVILQYIVKLEQAKRFSKL